MEGVSEAIRYGWAQRKQLQLVFVLHSSLTKVRDLMNRGPQALATKKGATVSKGVILLPWVVDLGC